MQLELWAPLLAQAGPLTIARLTDWQHPLRLWRHRLDRQEDASEFMTCLLRTLGPSSFEGSWEARLLQQEGARVLDRGGFLAPIRLMLQPDEVQVNIQILLTDGANRLRSMLLLNSRPLFHSWLTGFSSLGEDWAKMRRASLTGMLMSCFRFSPMALSSTMHCTNSALLCYTLGRDWTADTTLVFPGSLAPVGSFFSMMTMLLRFTCQLTDSTAWTSNGTLLFFLHAMTGILRQAN